MRGAQLAERHVVDLPTSFKSFWSQRRRRTTRPTAYHIQFLRPSRSPLTSICAAMHEIWCLHLHWPRLQFNSPLQVVHGGAHGIVQAHGYFNLGFSAALCIHNSCAFVTKCCWRGHRFGRLMRRCRRRRVWWRMQVLRFQLGLYRVAGFPFGFWKVSIEKWRDTSTSDRCHRGNRHPWQVPFVATL